MARRMDKTTIIVLSVVGSLGVLSAILGFSAEGTKLTHSDLLWFYGVCYYPNNPAVGLGVCAAIFLIIAQVTIAVVGGCYGCCKSRAIPSETNRIIVIVCAVVSWIATAIAFGLFVQGASSNRSGERDSTMLGLCYVLKDGIFAGAAVLTLAATALGLTSYVLLRRLPAAAPVAGAAVVAMGQPEFPQQTPPPNYGRFPPPPAQGSVAPEPNQQVPPPAQGYGTHAPNQNLQVPPPDPGYGAHAPNQHRPPPAQAYAAQAQPPNIQIQFDPSTLLNLGTRILRVATLSDGDTTVEEPTSEDLAQYQATEP